MTSFAGIATTPDSWVTLRGDVEGDPPGYEQVLDEAAESGYEGIELGDYGLLPIEPEVLREALSGRGLALAGAFLPIPLLDPLTRLDGTEDAIRVAQLLTDVEGETPILILADEYGKDPVRSGCAVVRTVPLLPESSESACGRFRDSSGPGGRRGARASG